MKISGPRRAGSRAPASCALIFAEALLALPTVDRYTRVRPARRSRTSSRIYVYIHVYARAIISRPPVRPEAVALSQSATYVLSCTRLSSPLLFSLSMSLLPQDRIDPEMVPSSLSLSLPWSTMRYRFLGNEMGQLTAAIIARKRPLLASRNRSKTSVDAGTVAINNLLNGWSVPRESPRRQRRTTPQEDVYQCKTWMRLYRRRMWMDYWEDGVTYSIILEHILKFSLLLKNRWYNIKNEYQKYRFKIFYWCIIDTLQFVSL